MSNINELILYEIVPIQSVNNLNQTLRDQGQMTTNQAFTHNLKNGVKAVGRGAGYLAGGTVAAPFLATMGANALANSGVGKGLFGAGVAGAAAHYGGQYAAQGLSNMAQYAADHGINNAVSSQLAEWVPGVGNAVSAGTSMAAQHLINKINDEKDRLRGINPTSSFLGNTIKNGIAGAAGFIGGPIASAVQGLRAGWAQHSLDKMKQQQGYMNAVNRNMMPQQQPTQTDQMNGY